VSVRARARRRNAAAGHAFLESVVIAALLGIGLMGAFIAAGARMHRDYRMASSTLASPYP
jgi:hypothetical protein